MINVVFVCVENSNRSQMAEAFARVLAKDGIKTYSAGSRPSGKINPKAIRSMSSRGIDISANESKSLTDLPNVEWDWVVTMGCGDACPHLRSKNRIDWQIPDPRDMSDEDFDKVRDEIEGRVQQLILNFK